MNKTYRQGQILKVVRSKRVYTQDELAQELKAEGIVATQVTLSRDIRDLGLAKTAQGYQELGVAVAEKSKQGFENFGIEFVTDVKSAQNLVVLRTTPGNASTVAVTLDAEGWPEIVGTVAGDDTILVVAPDNAMAEQLKEKFLQLLR